MENKKVLVVDSVRWVHVHFKENLKGKGITLLKALTLKEGKELFNANPNIRAVVMATCVSKDTPNSQGLVKEIRKKFKGPIIVISNYSDHRKEFIEVGCSHESEVVASPRKLLEVLGL
ncbi:hypothetical protein KJ786_03615 [Patescibacteria group bacterium]|nr:hypothetical protein [Patescibacteria group bacterium]